MDAARCFETSRRSWLRLHFSTWLLLLMPGTVLMLANIPGEYRLDWHNRKAIGCEHGWPCVWLVRQRLDGRLEDLWALTRDVCYVNAVGLTIDVLTAIAVLASLAAATEWRRRRRHRMCQFTLADWLVVVTIVGWLLAHVADRREKLYHVDRAVKAAGGALDDLEIDLPTWLHELSPDTEYVYQLAWCLGWCNVGVVDCEMPADETGMSILPPLLDLWPEHIKVTVCSQPRSRDDGPPIAFDPSALRSLAKLRHMTLEQADEEVLDCLDSLTELRSLEFGEECDPLGEAAVVHLKGLTNLRFLSVTRNCLGDAGIAAVAKLTSLETLSLTGASDVDLAELATLKHLRYLTLRDSTVTDAGLAASATHRQLEVIEVSGSLITGDGLAPLVHLRRLRKLDLNGSTLTDGGLASIGGISSLRELHLRNTPIAGPGLAHLGALSRLWRLDLSDTDIDDNGLAFLPELPALEELSLNFTRVTEKGISAFYRVPKLKALSLVYTRVANFRDFDLHRLPELKLFEFDGSRAGREEMVKLLAARPGLEFRRGRSCGMFPPGFAWQLAHARELAAKNIRPIILAVEGVEVGDQELASLRGLLRLDALCLRLTRVTDLGLAALLQFNELATIDLTGAPVSDAGLAYLARLPRLRAIDLSYTDVTAAGIIRLADFPALQAVSLDPSQITDEVILGLKRIPGLKHLAINGDFGLWGKKYRAARTFEAFINQLRAHLPQIDVSGKDHEFWAGASQRLDGCFTDISEG
ncbi:MAG TPA: hypothetical protein VG125_05280 [Pirellulales bacterium]|jgi:Leucine-rich repeat (LRR) protein|nr:hypothetical protein [Pirellulales bacterium]